jgi:hypothetical protein
MQQRYKPIVLVAVILGGGYGIHMLDRYMKISADSRKRAAVIIHPRYDEGSVSEIGYVYSMRNEIFLRGDDRINLVWFIKVPATGSRYSCSYERGFPAFRVGDDVRLIRPKDLAEDAGYGYVIGLHDKVSSKVALVWVNDEDQLEMDNAP